MEFYRAVVEGVGDFARVGRRAAVVRHKDPVFRAVELARKLGKGRLVFFGRRGRFLFPKRGKGHIACGHGEFFARRVRRTAVAPLFKRISAARKSVRRGESYLFALGITDRLGRNSLRVVGAAFIA